MADKGRTVDQVNTLRPIILVLLRKGTCTHMWSRPWADCVSEHRPYTHTYTLKIQIRNETGMELIRDVGCPKPDSSNSNWADFTVGWTRCPHCFLFFFPHRDLGMLLFLKFNKWLHTIGYLSAAPSIYSVVALIACVCHCFETCDDILTNICKTLWNI